jgi:hypothetical protein
LLEPFLVRSLVCNVFLQLVFVFDTVEVSKNSAFPWSEEDIAAIFGFTDNNPLLPPTYIAADTIYSNELTAAFFQQLRVLLGWRQNKTTISFSNNNSNTNANRIDATREDRACLYLALEKRINFSLETLEDSSVEYDYFISFLNIVDETSDRFDRPKVLFANINDANSQRNSSEFTDGGDSVCGGDNLRFYAYKLTLDFPKYFEYNRVEELELWKIWLE